MIVGLTGGIGSGKSTVANLFRELGVPVYDSDKEAKLLMNTSDKIKKALVKLLGKESYIDGKLNRTYISDKVFTNPELLAELNAIVHPQVKIHFKAWCAQQNYKYLIQESALIFENKSQNNYDKIILVTAPLEIRVARVVKRDNSSKDAVLQRVNNQLLDSEKIDFSDFIIENIDIKSTTESIKKVHDQLLIYRE